jgi:putative redox protein
MEMVLMSAGSCASVDVVSILKKAKQNLHRCYCELSGKRAESVPKVFTEIHLEFVVVGEDINEKHVERAVKLSADKYCSVAKMLEASVKMTHSYRIESPQQDD